MLFISLIQNFILKNIVCIINKVQKALVLCNNYNWFILVLIMIKDINFKTVFDDALYGAAIADMNGVLIYVNQAWADIHGLSTEDSIGQKLSIFHSLEHAETMDRLNKELLEKGRFSSEKVWRTRKDGTTFPALISASIVKNEAKDSSYISTVVQDVATIENTENAAYWKALRVLSGGISHDFNNILMGVLGHCTIAKKKLPENNPASQNLEHIQVASKRASNVIQRLQGFAGKKNITIESVKMHSIFDGFVKSLDESILSDIEISCNAKKCNGTFLADISQIHQILHNLYDNSLYAIKKAEKEKGIIKLFAEDVSFDGKTLVSGQYPNGSYVKLTFHDNGCGMKEETLKQIFTPFFSIKKKKDDAMGLGMPSVCGIVAECKGFVDVESKEKEGTFVYIYFPSEIYK